MRTRITDLFGIEHPIIQGGIRQRLAGALDGKIEALAPRAAQPALA